jgi:outer membrane protein OmpA-like peptidoglycan-associated protein
LRRPLFAAVAIIVTLVAGCQRQASRPGPEQAEPATASTHLSLATDALFAFGQATLAPDQRHVQLEQLATMLIRRRVTAVRLVGYTDRLGSAEANRSLSRRRAETVRDYLVVRGVPPDVFTVAGRGAADPLVRCPKLKGDQLIACLAPNRRVEVDLSVRD